jgi:transporter family-2 protein
VAREHARRFPLPRGVVSLPLILVFASGITWVIHITIVGRLGRDLGSPEVASGVTVTFQLGILLLAGAVIGAPGRARRRLAAGGRIRWWHVLAGTNGGLFLIVAAYATPKLGAVVVTVAIVAGQVVGGLVVDRIGLGPLGAQPVTIARFVAMAVALVAVVLGAGGTRGDLDVGLLALAALVGALTAVQQAALGHVARATGEPVLAAALNVIVGGAAIWAVALAVTGGSPPGGWSAPPHHWIGGLFGASTLFLLAAGARSLGILQLTLAVVAGQTFASLFVDLLAPPEGGGITGLTVLGLVLTVAAVLISGVGRRPRPVVAEPDFQADVAG